MRSDLRLLDCRTSTRSFYSAPYACLGQTPNIAVNNEFGSGIFFLDLMFDFVCIVHAFHPF